ncbi:MAG: PLP-dependent cysteine synthase family protein [Candidatus Xenobia bacterium]
MLSEAQRASARKIVPGPTYEEMLHPKGPAPNNLYRIGWHGVPLELPQEITGIAARIVVMLGYTYPSGSHKVGATYSIVMEAEKDGKIAPGVTKLIGPSTGNFGIGTAWTSFQKGYDGVVVMPDGMSPERTNRIRQYGSDIVYTPGTESDVILTIEKAKEIGQEANTYVLAQFENTANYRFHWYVTGNAILEKVPGRIAGFVSAPGSAGTICAGDRLKQAWPECVVAAAEPEQCSTLFNGGVGQHQIEGIGDKMAPLILNVNGIDRIILVDDQMSVDLMHYMATCRNYRYEFGISGMCNVIAAIKLARHLGLGKGDTVVTVATDGLDRYYSYLERLQSRTRAEAEGAQKRVASLNGDDGVLDVSGATQKERLHSLKEGLWRRWYPADLLAAMRTNQWWEKEQARVADYDARPYPG